MNKNSQKKPPTQNENLQRHSLSRLTALNRI